MKRVRRPSLGIRRGCDLSSLCPWSRWVGGSRRRWRGGRLPRTRPPHPGRTVAAAPARKPTLGTKTASWAVCCGSGMFISDPISRTWIYRPGFRKNKSKTLVFSHWKRAFWACFRENRVYKFGHGTYLSLISKPAAGEKYIGQGGRNKPPPPPQRTGWLTWAA